MAAHKKGCIFAEEPHNGSCVPEFLIEPEGPVENHLMNCSWRKTGVSHTGECTPMTNEPKSTWVHTQGCSRADRSFCEQYGYCNVNGTPMLDKTHKRSMWPNGVSPEEAIAAGNSWTQEDHDRAVENDRLTTREVRTTSSTGGQKGVKPERFDLIPIGPLTELAKLYGFGAIKYDAHNYRKGYEWSKSYAALQRHANQFWAGENVDPESGLSHMASVAFHAFALLEFVSTHPEFDDRYITEKETGESQADYALVPD